MHRRYLTPFSSRCYVHCYTESLVLDQSISPSGTLTEDLDKLPDLLESNVPAYILARLDDPPTEWMTIFYVPEDAKIRDKVRPPHGRQAIYNQLVLLPDAVRVFAQQSDQGPRIGPFH